MRFEKPQKRTGDLTAEQIAKMWKDARRTPPGPIQTVEQSLEAKRTKGGATVKKV